MIYSSVHLFSPPHGRGRFIRFSGYAADLQLSQQSSHTKLNKDIFLLLAYTRPLPVCLGGKACISSLRSREAKFIWTRTKFIHEDQLSCWQLCAASGCETEPYTPVCVPECTCIQVYVVHGGESTSHPGGCAACSTRSHRCSS